MPPGPKSTGAVLLFSCISAFLSLVFGELDVSGKAFRAGGYCGDWLAHELTAYLNRTGSLIVLVTLIFLAVIISTQFSFGRFFARLSRMVGGAVERGVMACREWREERRRDKQRREVIAKHTKKGAPPPDIRDPKSSPGAAASSAASTAEADAVQLRSAREREEGPAAGPTVGGAKSLAPPKPPR